MLTDKCKILPITKLTIIIIILPVTVSEMLAEDRRVWGHYKDFITHGKVDYGHHHIYIYLPCK